ncbi:MAG: hypothetical protein ACD_33C00021G0002 [uncultured bacterium]|nr:MAG: hypothetical protein ACD_33C00021G0002 [uncultured bacterium]
MTPGDGFSVLGNTILAVDDTYCVYGYAWPYGDDGRVSKKYNFKVKCAQEKYTPYQLAWENSIGGYDYFSFNKVSTENVSVAKNSFVKDRYLTGLNSRFSYMPEKYLGTNEISRGKVISQIQKEKIVTLNTDWLTDTQLKFLEDLITSKEVYLLDESVYGLPDSTAYIPSYIYGRWYSAEVLNESIMTKTNAKGLKQLSVDIAYANKNIY